LEQDSRNEQQQQNQPEPSEEREEYSRDRFVTVFASRSHSAEIECEVIHGLLESADLHSMIVRENVQEVPTGQVEVRVLSSQADDARELIRDAQQSGRLEEQISGDAEE